MENTALNADFADFITALNKHEVEYVVIGGYAVGFHGYLRATIDLDLYVRRQAENAQRLKAAVEEFSGVVVDDRSFMQERTLFRMGSDVGGIEILNYIIGVDENKALKNAMSVDIGGLPIKFISLDDLIANKRAVGRMNDLIDVQNLEAVRRDLAQQKQSDETKSLEKKKDRSHGFEL